MTLKVKLKTKFLFLIFALVSLSCISKAQETGFPSIRNYTSNESLNNPYIMCVLQGPSGIMYYGVNEGILVYDGVSWQIIPNGRKTFTSDMAMDSQGKIYVAAGSDFGFIDFEVNGKPKFKSLAFLIQDTSLVAGSFRSVTVTHEIVYFQTNDAIYQYSPSRDSIKIYKADSNGSFNRGFVFKDVFYVQLYQQGLLKIEDNELKPASQSIFFKNSNLFRVVLPYNDSTVLIATRHQGLYLYQPEKDVTPQKFNLMDTGFVTDNDLYEGIALQNDCFILGSSKGAIWFNKQGNVLQHCNEANGLQNEGIWDLTKALDNNVWFGSNHGISKTGKTLDLSHWDKSSGLQGSVQSIIRHGKSLYIATDTKIYFIDKNNQLRVVAQIPTGQNWCFLETKNTKTLLAGTQYGIYEIQYDKAKPVFEGNHILKIYQSPKNENRIYGIGYQSFMSFQYVNGKWQLEGSWAGLHDVVRGIIEDQNGEIWLSSSSNGVIRVTPNNDSILHPKKVRYYNHSDGLASLTNVMPYTFKNKIVWATEKGLYMYHPETDRFEPFCDLSNNLCNGAKEVYSLIEMPDGKIWTRPVDLKKSDIGYFQPNSNGTYDWVYAPFRRIPEMFVLSYYVEPTGIAWIGGSEGLYRYDKNLDRTNYTQTFPCLIRKISIGSDSLLYAGYTSFSKYANPEGSIKSIEFQYNTIKFEFAAPFFDHEEKTVYCYQLIGYDKEWSKWSRETIKEYTNLTEGAYTFRVKARNVYDVESEMDYYQFRLLPPVYRTFWAFIIYAILFILFIIAILKFYTRHLVAQKDHLEQIVFERTAKIRQQKEEIQTQKEELMTSLNNLQQTQKQLVQSEKMASLGVLAAGIAHEINNPLNFIQGGVAGIKEYFKSKPIDHESNIDFYLNAISEGVENASQIVSGLNHFSRAKVPPSDKIDIHKLIDTCLIIIGNITNYKIDIIKNFSDKPYSLSGNEGQLHQVILSILLNSVQSIDKEGSIIITTEIENNEIIVSIKDTGCGIKEEYLSKIFDPFFTTKDPGKGPGLGLSTAYIIIQEHQGTIDIQSQLGIGTTARINLPINRIK